MKHRPIKIQIKIRKPMGYDWVRFWPVEKMLLDEASIIKTEGQLCYYIFKKYGVGRFQLLAWQKGYKGFWIFWLGDILPNGYIRDKNKNKELRKLKLQLNKSNDDEERELIREDIDITKEIKTLETYKRYGPTLIKTERPGILHPYEEIK